MRLARIQLAFMCAPRRVPDEEQQAAHVRRASPEMPIIAVARSERDEHDRAEPGEADQTATGSPAVPPLVNLSIHASP
ncbi:MAG TPA: hypothetical protein VF875_07795 [Anaeromyxobacter sp.]